MARPYTIRNPEAFRKARQEAGRRRWEGLTPEQRREALQSARDASCARNARVRALLAEQDALLAEQAPPPNDKTAHPEACRSIV